MTITGPNSCSLKTPGEGFPGAPVVNQQGENHRLAESLRLILNLNGQGEGNPSSEPEGLEVDR